MRDGRRFSSYRGEDPEQQDPGVTDRPDGDRSRIVLLVVVVALMAGFFFLGYKVGKYQSESGVSSEAVTPLPEIPLSEGTKTEEKKEVKTEVKTEKKTEEYTFYKTLTDRNDKTVPITDAAEPQKAEPRPVSSGSVRSTPPVGEAKPEQREVAAAKRDTPAPVKSKARASREPRPAPLKQSAAAPSPAKRRFTVQIASYQDLSHAEVEVKRLKEKGYAAFSVATDLPGKGKRYRVRIGSFPDRAAAEKLTKKLHAKEGLSPIITAE